ncbi:hypothetical protein [Cyclobacterium sp. SYSU L10401]|uniref:hypothetical protein n=1 Tax=Cyclobacterium sp. SYSU L10401 TaxID=2678657 RepID=UPI0013D239E3|nr:hypothetical protein [Cyclobacterium sp. SYSU L10401]
MTLDAIVIISNGDSVKCNNQLSTLPSTLRNSSRIVIVNDGSSSIEINKSIDLFDLTIVNDELWELLREQNLDFLPDCSKKLRIGTGTWNTPVARSVAQLICKIFQLEKILFLDDDYIFKGEEKNLLELISSGLSRNIPTLLLSNGHLDNSSLKRFKNKISKVPNKYDDYYDGIGGSILIPKFNKPFYFPKLYGEDIFWIHSFEDFFASKSSFYHNSTKTDFSRMLFEETDIVCFHVFDFYSNHHDLSSLPLIGIRRDIKRILAYRLSKLSSVAQNVSATIDKEFLETCKTNLNGQNIDDLAHKVITELTNNKEWNEFFSN